MEAGQLIAGRFVVERLAGAGGMGRVYRALDRRTGEHVAFKVLSLDARRYSRRFNREARMLAELDHPGIVRYVDHGVTEAGSPYIVMEWLEGEDLRTRMNRRRLDPDEIVALARQVGRALGAAHARGVVHRDLKPSNLMLVDRELSRTKLLDFGIARWRGPLVEKMTKTGISIGTPGYMAPEQARGDRDVGGAADVYALGCVLFECMTGRRPFSGDMQVAVLAKTVLEQAPRVAQFRQDVSDELDAILARMLSSDPAGRPADGHALADALDSLERATRPRGTEVIAAPSLTRGERRLLCVILVGDADDARPDTDGGEGQGDEVATPRYRGDAAAAGARPSIDSLARTATEFGGRLDRLVSGAAVVTFSGSGAATDLVAQAARCALALREVSAQAPIAIATGQGEVTGTHAIGEAIDRAARLLRDLDDGGDGGEVGAVSPIRVDDVTAGLLDRRFEVVGTAPRLELAGRHALPGSKRLLGRPTRCVGRDRELAYLGRAFDACVQQGRPRASLVIAPAGAGKSRLASELVQRLRDRHPQLELWIGRGDPLARGSAFDILGQLVRSAAGIVKEEPLPDRQRKLGARVARSVGSSEALRVAEFLGEMSGTPFPAADDRVQLRAARASAVLMGDQIRRAWEDFLGAESRRQPTLIVLEDLHFGDVPTVRFIDGALRNVTRGAWMLLALARPEVREVFPDLWSERAVEIVGLSELGGEACAELVREALGDRAGDDTVARLVKLAGGNAFYLEELIRVAADGREGEVPGTIMAMAQARLGDLPATSRRVLRAASVFGRVFWLGGLRALVGHAGDGAEVDDVLESLVDLEFVTPTPSTIFPDQIEYVFRHELMREAAYSTLTDGDRILGHRLAGGWLEHAGSRDALALATHFELGNEPARATIWYQESAEHAFEGNDLSAALRRAERGLACGAEGATRGALRATEARALLWRGEFADAVAAGEDAMKHLEHGSAAWYAAAGDVAASAGRTGRDVDIIAIANQLLDAEDDEAQRAARMSAMARAGSRLFLAGRYDEASLLVSRFPPDLDRFSRSDPATVGNVLTARAQRALCDGDPGLYLELCEESARYFDHAGDRRSASLARVNVGFASAELGDYASAESVLRGVLEIAEHMEMASITALAQNNLGMVLACQGQLDEAWDLELVAIENFAMQGDDRLANGSRVYLAFIHEQKGHLEAAEREAREAVAGTADIPTVRMQALAQLASVLLGQGRLAEALVAAEESFELHQSLGQVDEGEARIRLVLAEAYAACGRHHEARATLGDACRRLRERVERIADPSFRSRFLDGVAVNRRTLEMGRSWGVQDA